jgi:hypothetical protein
MTAKVSKCSPSSVLIRFRRETIAHSQLLTAEREQPYVSLAQSRGNRQTETFSRQHEPTHRTLVKRSE